MRIRRALTLLSFVAIGLLATFSLAVGGRGWGFTCLRGRHPHLCAGYS